MTIIEAKIFSLRIPFTEGFSHATKARNFSDSIVVRLRSEDGTHGYGEGVARPYVTGETVETSIAHIENKLWPLVAGKDFPEIVPGDDPVIALAPVDEALPDQAAGNGVIAWHAARSAIELALIDCLLRQQKISLAQILRPARSVVTYSGVITSGSTEKAVQRAKGFKLFGIEQLKIKINGDGTRKRIAAIRDVVGPHVSLRVDANGAYGASEAVNALAELIPFNIASAEQPVSRGSLTEFAGVRQRSTIPLMADESLVTFADARALIEIKACDYFNLRISKCGGIVPTLKMARLALRAGLKIQLGSHVGETAILSAAGRHVAAHLCDLEFVEGSYGQLLLAEDVGRDAVNFGHGGRAPVLRGAGLGVKVLEEILYKYAHRVVTLKEN